MTFAVRARDERKADLFLDHEGASLNLGAAAANKPSAAPVGENVGIDSHIHSRGLESGPTAGYARVKMPVAGFTTDMVLPVEIVNCVPSRAARSRRAAASGRAHRVIGDDDEFHVRQWAAIGREHRGRADELVSGLAEAPTVNPGLTMARPWTT